MDPSRIDRKLGYFVVAALFLVVRRAGLPLTFLVKASVSTPLAFKASAMLLPLPVLSDDWANGGGASTCKLLGLPRGFVGGTVGVSGVGVTVADGVGFSACLGVLGLGAGRCRFGLGCS